MSKVEPPRPIGAPPVAVPAPTSPTPTAPKLAPLAVPAPAVVLKPATAAALTAPIAANPEYDSEPVRIYVKTGGLPTTHKALAAMPVAGIGKAKLKTKPVSDADVAKAMQTAQKTRASELKTLNTAKSAARMMPEDLSLRVEALIVVAGSDQDYIKALARIGAIEGFRIRVQGTSSELGELQQGLTAKEWALIDPIVVPDRSTVWFEDNGEIGLDGSVTMQALLPDDDFARQAIYRGRMARFYPSATVPGASLGFDLLSKYPKVNFHILGGVNKSGEQDKKAAFALATSAPLRESFSYTEGGNVLSGTLPNGEAYALVGKDSVAVSKALMEKQLGRKVSEAEVLLAIAKDLGVPMKNVHAVEQPGDFHLDMSMSLMGPGQVVLDDAVAAAKLQAKWLREDALKVTPFGSEQEKALQKQLDDLMAHAKALAVYEAETAKELEAKGFSVVRLPGRFFAPGEPDREIMNFLNGEGGVNAKGERFFITQGGDKRAEALIAQKLTELGAGLSHVYFMPRHLTDETLPLLGALSCRTKAIGKIVPKSAEPSS